MMRALAAAILLAAMMVGAAHAQGAPRFDDLPMNAVAHAGLQRSIGLYVPPTYNREHPAPLIIALHNRFSSAKAFHALSGLRALADARGAILAYPETVEGFWNDGGLAALRRTETPQDDRGFIAATLDAVANGYAIDRDRVFLIGYDAGGGMAYRLACENRLHLAGVAVVSALMWTYTTPVCDANTRPTPMLIVHGERDPLYPVRGGVIPARTGITTQRLSSADTLALWRRVNGCAGPSESRGGSSYYANCREGSAAAYVEVEGGEHDWFNDRAGHQLNRQGVDATALIGTFFFDRPHFTLPNPRGSALRARSYIAYVPPNYDPTQPTPVLLLLHGRPDNASNMADGARMNPVAARNRFIVVYPEGLNNEWNSFADLVGRRATAPQDDVAFLETLVRDLSLDLNIDRRRIYVSGFSNGGFMTIRLACTASDFFAGFAAVGAELYSVLTSQCRGRPAPILFMHGTGDESVAYTGVVQADGRGGEPTRVSLGVQDTVAFFIRRNHCSFSGATTRIPESGRSPGTSVIRFAPRDCADGADVMFYLINGGSHSWPGVHPEGGPFPVNMDINASDEIWNFLQSHRLPEAPPS